MSWHDRRYEAEDSYAGPATGRVRRPPPTTLVLMIVHALAFLAALMFRADANLATAERFLTLAPAAHPAAILLHPLATTRLFTTLFVVLALWSLGGRIELRIGARRLVSVYLAANVAAGLVHFVLASVQPTLAAEPLDYPVGALAALCGLAWSRLRGDPVAVFGKITTAAKVYAICGLVVALLVVVRNPLGAAAWVAAAAAGLGCGLLSERLPTWRGHRRVRPSIPHRPPPAAESNLDDILAKISRGGLDSLSDDERQQLESLRQQRLRRDD